MARACTGPLCRKLLDEKSTALEQLAARGQALDAAQLQVRELASASRDRVELAGDKAKVRRWRWAWLRHTWPCLSGAPAPSHQAVLRVACVKARRLGKAVTSGVIRT